MTLYLKAGFWQLYELDTDARRARSPATPTPTSARVTADWARQWFSDDPATVDRDRRGDGLSRQAIEQGMYIEPFAEQRVFAIGLEPPPMMWIFEWDILTGDSAVLDVLYAISRDATGGDIEAAIAGGEQAVADVERMRELGRDRRMPRPGATPALRDAFLGTLDYEVDVLRLLAAYRAMILYQGEWHDTLSPDAYDAWEADRDEFEALAAAHIERYEGDIDYPAYNLTAARARRASAPTAISRWRGSRAHCCSSLACVGRHRHARRRARGWCAGRAPPRRARRGSPRPVRGGRASRRSGMLPARPLAAAERARRRCWSRPAPCRPRSCRGRTSPSCSARGSSSRSSCGCCCAGARRGR